MFLQALAWSMCHSNSSGSWTRLRNSLAITGHLGPSFEWIWCTMCLKSSNLDQSIILCLKRTLLQLFSTELGTFLYQPALGTLWVFHTTFWRNPWHENPSGIIITGNIQTYWQHQTDLKLVGQGHPVLKNMSSSIGMMTFPIDDIWWHSQYFWEKNQNGNQTTNQEISWNHKTFPYIPRTSPNYYRLPFATDQPHSWHLSTASSFKTRKQLSRSGGTLASHIHG